MFLLSAEAVKSVNWLGEEIVFRHVSQLGHQQPDVVSIGAGAGAVLLLVEGLLLKEGRVRKKTDRLCITGQESTLFL